MSIERTSWAARALVPSAFAALFASTGCGGQPVDAAAPEAGPAAIAPASARSIAEAATPTTASDAGPVARLAEQVAQLRREVADLRRRLPPDVPVAAASAADKPGDPRRDPQARERLRQDERARVAAAEAAFLGESVDPAWSADVTARLRDALAGREPADAASVSRLECRSRTCRVEFGADASAAERDLPRTLARLAGTLSRATAGRLELGGGREATVLYLSN